MELREIVSAAMQASIEDRDFYDPSPDEWLMAADAAIRTVVDALRTPKATAVAFALPLTHEPTEGDWTIGDEACAVLDCVNVDGELAAAQLTRDYRNVLDAMAVFVCGQPAPNTGDAQ